MGTLTVIRIPALCLDCGHYLADRARLWITHAAGLAWMLSGSLMDRRGYCVVVLASCLLTAASANYAPYHDPGQGSHKLNDIYNAPVKRYSPSFKSDASIGKYLRMFGMKVMLWRCKNALQPHWNYKPIDAFELHCETIGTVKKIDWFHNDHLIDTTNKSAGGHYRELAFPHQAHGNYYSQWIDFKLIIQNATSRDTGMYTFRVTGTDGKSDQQIIYVDISKKKRKKKSRRKKYGMRWDNYKLEKKAKKLRKRANAKKEHV